MELSAWERLVRPHYDFLDGYGFTRATRFDRFGNWATSVVYASAGHAVRVTHSVEFCRSYTQKLWMGLRTKAAYLPG